MFEKKEKHNVDLHDTTNDLGEYKETKLVECDRTKQQTHIVIVSIIQPRQFISTIQVFFYPLTFIGRIFCFSLFILESESEDPKAKPQNRSKAANNKKEREREEKCFLNLFVFASNYASFPLF